MQHKNAGERKNLHFLIKSEEKMKKYVLKEENEKFADGTANDEHIKDIISQIKVCYDNIQANIDVCFEMFKLKQDSGEDEDLVDAISLVCEDATLVEKEGEEIISIISKAEENIGKYSKENELDFSHLLCQIQKLEEKSAKYMEKVLK